jgi:hypothetical protein
MIGRREFGLGVAALVAVGTRSAHGDEIPDDAIILGVGDSVTVTFTRSGDLLVKPLVLGSQTVDDPTAVFALKESDGARTLSVSHGFEKSLSFRAVAKMRGRKRRFPMPVAPVAPGTRRLWTTTDLFHELALFEFTLSGSP